MPHATLCLDCRRPAQCVRGRCPDCTRARNQADYYQSPEWRRLRKAARARADECAICGSTTRLIAHHSRGRAEGGADDLQNVRVLLCGAEAIGKPWLSCHNQYEADKRTGKDTEL